MKRLTLPLIGVALLTTAHSAAYADATRADSHAPIGVMGDHTHAQGEVMLSYRYMDMSMDQNYAGSQKVSTSDIHAAGYGVAPQSMDMTMHMLGAMYAPSDTLTLMAMLPHITNDMSLRSSMMAQNMMNARPRFTTESSGIGDVKLGGLYQLHSDDKNTLIFNAMISLPTGSIDEEDTMANPMMGEMHMPYPMQLGSGTVDLLPGLTFTQKHSRYSWGSQIKATLRTGDNDNGYTLGDRYRLNTWIAKPIGHRFSLSGRASFEHWDNIDGSDKQLTLMPNMVPTADPKLRGGEQTSLHVGFNYVLADGDTGNQRLALEWGEVVAHDLKGPQLGTSKILTLGYQIAF